MVRESAREPSGSRGYSNARTNQHVVVVMQVLGYALF